MNTDIERLAKEAGWDVDADGITMPYLAGYHDPADETAFLAKFAGLLADDIAQIVLDMSCGKPLEWAENVADAIRAKFPMPPVAARST